MGMASLWFLLPWGAIASAPILASDTEHPRPASTLSVSYHSLRTALSTRLSELQTGRPTPCFVSFLMSHRSSRFS